MGLRGAGLGGVVGAPTRQKSPITSLRPGWVGPAQQGGQKAHHQLQELSSTQTTRTGQGSQDHPSCPWSWSTPVNAGQPPRPRETPARRPGVRPVPPEGHSRSPGAQEITGHVDNGT